MANFEKKTKSWKNSNLDKNENWTELKLENNEKLDISSWKNRSKRQKSHVSLLQKIHSLPTMHDFRLASIKSENSQRREKRKEK